MFRIINNLIPPLTHQFIFNSSIHYHNARSPKYTPDTVEPQCVRIPLPSKDQDYGGSCLHISPPPHHFPYSKKLPNHFCVNKICSIGICFNASILDCVDRGLVCLRNVCLFLLFSFLGLSHLWFKFWVIFLTMYIYLPSIAIVTQHTGCNFLLTLIYSNNNSKTVSISIFIRPGLISLLHLDPLQE